MIDVAAIERATIAAVSPDHVEEAAGWLLAIDPGTMRRAASAVPLSHDVTLTEARLAEIEAVYQAHGLTAAFRMADVAGLAPACAMLSQAGYVAEQPTLVEICPTEALARASDDLDVDLYAQPCDGWADVFMAPGFDPVDGASRVRVLSRSPHARFGAVRVDGRPVAVGVGSFGGGWCSVHGMRTAPACRGQGFASRLLGAFGREALIRGLSGAFLQVEETNIGARSLYERIGFKPAWRYHYWSRR